MRFAEGLLFAHAFLVASYVIGASVLWVRDRADSSAQAAIRVVCTCAVGIAVYGFAVFLLGIAGLFSPPFLAASIVVIVLAGSLLRRQSPLSSAYWIARFRDVFDCWDFPSLVLYSVMLALALPSVIPNVGGDPVTYHLAYAEDWAQAGRLIIDPFVRFPFYASNFTLIIAALFATRGDVLVNFLTWAAALLTALGVCGSVRVILQKALAYRWAAIAGVALALSVVLSPTYLRWLPTAYLDIAIGAFALLAVLCMQLAFIEQDWRWLAAFAVTAGFFLGMKSAFLILLPVFAAALIWSAKLLRPGRVNVALLLALFCICAAPWYVRNTVLAGDPVAPVLNIALHGNDGIMSKAEWQGIQSDLQTSRSASAFLSLPVRAFTNPLDRDFREYGSSALILFLFVPIILVIVEMCFVRKADAFSRISVFLLLSFIVYWFGTATMLRYALLFYPTLAVCVAVTVAPFLRGRFAGPFAALIAFGMIVPTPSARPFLEETYFTHYRYLPRLYTSDDSYLRSFGPGYTEEQFTTRFLRSNGVGGRVYVFGSEFSDGYYFRRSGFMGIGDWSGPASYFRLATAIATGQAIQYFDDLDVSAVEIAGANWSLSGLSIPLEHQLLKGGFCAIRVPETSSRLLVRFNENGFFWPAPLHTHRTRLCR